MRESLVVPVKTSILKTPAEQGLWKTFEKGGTSKISTTRTSDECYKIKSHPSTGTIPNSVAHGPGVPPGESQQWEGGWPRYPGKKDRRSISHKNTKTEEKSCRVS